MRGVTQCCFGPHLRGLIRMKHDQSTPQSVPKQAGRCCHLSCCSEGPHQCPTAHVHPGAPTTQQPTFKQRKAVQTEGPCQQLTGGPAEGGWQASWLEVCLSACFLRGCCSPRRRHNVRRPSESARRGALHVAMRSINNCTTRTGLRNVKAKVVQHYPRSHRGS